MKKKDYWFLLKSHIYVSFKQDRVLLYNTTDGNSLEIINREIISLVEAMYIPENLGVVFLKKELLDDEAILELVKELLSLQMGQLLEIMKGSKKPVALIPLLNLQRDVDRLKDKNELSTIIGEGILRNLLEINIYINNICDKRCPSCLCKHKQFLCCTSTETEEELSISDIETLMFQAKYSGICRINILGGNVYRYKQLTKLIQVLNDFRDMVYFYVYYKNYEQGLLDMYSLDVMVDLPIERIAFDRMLLSVGENNVNWNFIVKNETEYFECEELIEKYRLVNYLIHPFYSGNNSDFFHDYVYMGKEDILGQKYTMREIFRNQKLNANTFGKLYIFPDGSTKASINSPELENIKSKKLIDIVHKEMMDNTAWRKVRDMAPCNKCIYQYLCPSPSNYELVIGKPNLCHINP